VTQHAGALLLVAAHSAVLQLGQDLDQTHTRAQPPGERTSTHPESGFCTEMLQEGVNATAVGFVWGLAAPYRPLHETPQKQQT